MPVWYCSKPAAAWQRGLVQKAMTEHAALWSQAQGKFTRWAQHTTDNEGGKQMALERVEARNDGLNEGTCMVWLEPANGYARLCAMDLSGVAWVIANIVPEGIERTKKVTARLGFPLDEKGRIALVKE